MIQKASSFQQLMQFIDADCIGSKKKRIYYSISTDGKNESSVVARSVIRPNNTPALSFLIRSFVSTDEYILTYLSQIDTIEILSKLDKKKKNELWTYLAKLYRGELKLADRIVIQRAPINAERTYTVMSTSNNVVRIPASNKNDSTGTSFGFDINFNDFCECLSLMLSMEPTDKLKVVLAKYLVLSDLISGKTIKVAAPDYLLGVQNIAQLESAYNRLSDTVEGREAYDLENFGGNRYAACFPNNT